MEHVSAALIDASLERLPPHVADPATRAMTAAKMIGVRNESTICMANSPKMLDV